MTCERCPRLLRAVRTLAGLDDAAATLRAVPSWALEEAAASRGWVFRRFVRLPGEETIAGEEWMLRGSARVFIPSDTTLGDFEARVAECCATVAKYDGCTPAEVMADAFEAESTGRQLTRGGCSRG